MPGKEEGKGMVNSMERAETYCSLAKKAQERKRVCIVHTRQRNFIIVSMTIVLLNIVSWQSETFSDWYITYIFPIWGAILGRLTSLCFFSVGEVLIWVAVLLLVGGCGLLLTLLFFHKESMVRGWTKRWWSTIAWTINIVLLVQTLNCFILYHGTTLLNHTTAQPAQYQENLIPLFNQIAKRANALCGTFPRDAHGFLTVDESGFAEETKQSLGRLQEQYPNLTGYYPDPKPVYASGVMSQENLMGIYFPYSMEATYNEKMYVVNKPYVMCHELSHLKGYIREDEANYLAYRACMASDNLFFQYSGCLGVLNYIANAINQNVGSLEEDAIKTQMVSLDACVQTDNIFLTQQSRDAIPLIRTNRTGHSDLSTRFLDASLRLNGISQGSDSYQDVVKLMLQDFGKGQSEKNTE